MFYLKHRVSKNLAKLNVVNKIVTIEKYYHKLNSLFLNYHSKSSCTLKIEMVKKLILAR